jgi:acylphosphatase
MVVESAACPKGELRLTRGGASLCRGLNGLSGVVGRSRLRAGTTLRRMPAVRCDIIFTGHVQGVGFRYTACQIAEGYDIVGWVRNEPDGSVRCVVEGSPEQVDRFIAALQQAMAGHIRDARIGRSQATGEFAGFAVRR